MFQYRHTILLYLLIFGLILLVSGCNPSKQISFEVQPDESDFINYAFGGGELGAEATQVFILCSNPIYEKNLKNDIM